MKQGKRKLKDVSLLRFFLSYIFPVRIKKIAGDVNPLLELYIFRGRWQLATLDALYSDGRHYRPLVVAFDELKNTLPSIKNVLVLGTGLGSAVQIMAGKKCFPHYILVDHDRQILELAIELMDESLLKYIEPVCADAKQYVADNTKKFDLVIVDIFEGRVVPSFATEGIFLKQCRQSLAHGGRLVFNYMIQNKESWEKDSAVFSAVFSQVKEIPLGINRLLIATV